MGVWCKVEEPAQSHSLALSTWLPHTSDPVLLCEARPWLKQLLRKPVSGPSKGLPSER